MSSLVVFIFIFIFIQIMGFHLSPEELAQFHAYIQQGGSLAPTPPTPSPAANLQPLPFQHTQTSSFSPSQSRISGSNQIQQISPQGLPPSQSSQASSLAVTQPLSSTQPQIQTQVQPPPISQLYQNIRPHLLGHPATTASCPGITFNPFLGSAALSLSTNQARMASASATIPHNPSLFR